jgi:hypothetical protein
MLYIHHDIVLFHKIFEIFLFKIKESIVIMTGIIEQERERASDYRKKHIEYPCGCRYFFDHQILLEQVCPEHEGELITHNG